MTLAARAFDGLRPYLNREILATSGLGIAAGFPLTMVISLMGIWLSRFGVSKGDVGLFALITSFYSLKFLWAPMIDQMSLGSLTNRFGQRRGWLLALMTGIAATLLILAQLDPATQLFSVALVAMLLAFLSASQDIVIDAYRIEITAEDNQGYSAAAYVYGYRIANFIAGVGVLLVAEALGWAVAISLLPLLLIPGLIGILILGEPGGVPDAPESVSLAAQIRTAVVEPFRAFMRRDMWLLVLLFIVFFKAGDAVTAIMTGPLIVDMGFRDLDIAYANKTVGAISLLVGVGLGASLFKLLGTYPSLLMSGILMMLTNLGFAWLAGGDAEPWRLALTVGLENFATGLGATVTIAYMASLCDLHFTATQFALLSALAGSARTVLGAPSGFVADAVGWVNFFVIATFAALPGLVLLTILWRRGAGVPQERGADNSGGHSQD